METVLITGGAGFIGYHLTKYLLERQQRVIIYDNFADYYEPSLKWANAIESQKLGAKIVQGDILNSKFLLRTLRREHCSKVVHLAAQPGVRYSTLNPDKTLRVNIEGTANVLTASRKAGILRIVLTSSSSVFGKVLFLPLNENHPKQPISIYGASKLAVEQLVEVFRHLYPELDIVLLRPFTVVGARQRPDMAINKFVSKAFEGQEITIFGDGNQTRDWTHVENMAQALYLALSKKKAKNQDFNIGNGTRISVKRVLSMVSEITHRELFLTYRERDRADAKDTCADISKAKQLLGYTPQKTLFDAIEDFTEDYLTTKRRQAETTLNITMKSSFAYSKF